MLIGVTNVFLLGCFYRIKNSSHLQNLLLGYFHIQVFFLQYLFFFEKSSSVKIFPACSVLLSIFIRLSDRFNMLLKLFGKFLNLNENS